MGKVMERQLPLASPHFTILILFHVRYVVFFVRLFACNATVKAGSHHDISNVKEYYLLVPEMIPTGTLPG